MLKGWQQPFFIPEIRSDQIFTNLWSKHFILHKTIDQTLTRDY
ncbi:hypothetical protein PULV_b0026 [Pseudoalteromonas ulvae UL12]|nr:hypothetical protein [Pseudoalteromonas ulvae UL12]